MKFADIFGNGAVLQRRKPICIWGKDEQGSHITVTLGTVSATTPVLSGQWKVTLPAFEAASGLVLTAVNDQGDSIFLSDIAVGEVWIAGGQSNMEFVMRWDGERNQVLPSYQNRSIRFYECPKVSYEGQLEEEDHSDEGFWRYAEPGDSAYFSAVGFYFARRLQEYLTDIPIGIIGCNWGGSSASTWMPEECLDGRLSVYRDLKEKTKALDLEEKQIAFKESRKFSRSPEAKANLDAVMSTIATVPMDTQNPPPGFEEFLATKYAYFSPFSAGCLYRTMLSKIVPYTVAGVIWYQGEEDADATYGGVYDELFPRMIGCWRDCWQEELPFLFVQLAAFTNPGGIMEMDFTPLRTVQEQVSKTVPNTWMVPAYDTGMRYDIHPKNKRPVGERLALQAIAHVYGGNVLSEAPEIQGAEKRDGAITLRLLHCGDGLKIKGTEAKGIALSVNGQQQDVFSVEVYDNSIRVHCDTIHEDSRITVSYAYMDYCEVNLYNSADLPVRPFTVTL